jgi:predicted esterase
MAARLRCVWVLALALGCSGEAGTEPEGTAGGAGTGGSAGAGGSSTVDIGGSASGGAAGTAPGGGGMANAGSGGLAGGGSGGMAIDPNGGAPSGPSSTRHRAVALGTKPGAKNGYWEYLPPRYGNGARYPLLVFFHGVGENGDGSLAVLEIVTKNGPPRLVEDDEWPEARPFVLLSPQHPGQGCPGAQEIDEFLGFALDEYDIDLARVYITGLSCGASGSWNYLAQYSDELVAAAVLVCGDGRSAFQAAGCGLGKVPIWAFHGDADSSVNVEGSRSPIESLNACQPPAAEAKLTVYPGVGHDSWTQTYDLSAGHDPYAWLLTHSKE